MTDSPEAEIKGYIYDGPLPKQQVHVETLGERALQVWVTESFILSVTDLEALPFVEHVRKDYGSSDREVIVELNPCWDQKEAMFHLAKHLLKAFQAKIKVQEKSNE